MRIFLKQLILFLGISGLLLIMAGCGDNNGGGGLEDAEIKQAIEARANSFKAAVEAYNVEGMLDFLEEETDSDKKIAIAEGGNNPYYKNFNKLETELKEDAGKQQYWRENYGYTLTMELETIAYSNLTASGAYATVFFTIKEAAEEIPQQITDQGNMVCEMVKLGGNWRCRKMTINFNSDQAGASSVGRSAPSISYQAARKLGRGTERTGGFGYGRFDFE